MACGRSIRGSRGELDFRSFNRPQNVKTRALVSSLHTPPTFDPGPFPSPAHPKRRARLRSSSVSGHPSFDCADGRHSAQGQSDPHPNDVSVLDSIQCYASSFPDLASALPAQHPVEMARQKTGQGSHRATGCVAETDNALAKFVEALAIADARRDHLREREPLTKCHLDAVNSRCRSNGVHDEARSHLRQILDRAPKRKID